MTHVPFADRAHLTEGSTLRNAISWFELPVIDLDRAARFYSTVLGTDPSPAAQAEQRIYRVFPAGEGVAGAIVQAEGYIPSSNGALIFLNAGEALQPALERVERAGGRVITPRIDIGEWGVAALIVDSEGNKVALHSPR